MNENRHTGIYSAEDIQNYLSGRLTPLQMNAMEKAALDDPFLAEAMEGYAAVPGEDFKKQLGALKQGFAQQQTGARVIPLSKRKNNWWKAAAAVFIIGTTATLSYIFFTGNKQPEIAKNADTPAAAKDTVTVVNSNTGGAQAENVIVAQNIPQKDYKTVIKDLTREPREQLTDSSFVYSPSRAKESKPADDASAKNDLEEVAAAKPAAQAPATANAAPPVSLNNTVNVGYEKNNAAEYDQLKKEKKADAFVQLNRQEPPLNRSFFAQVFSPDNTPLPFANINVKSENFGTYTDVKGNFRLLSNDSLLTVEVKAAGFRPQMVTLRSNTQQNNRIVLAEDNTPFADKTVISSTAKNKLARKTVLVKDSVQNVEPADGWDNYTTYVDNNIEIPDDILKNNIHGQVELSFNVKANGAITNIKVDKSLCGNCDEAAIRMLQQGPQWKVKKGKKGKGKITVQF